MSEWIRVNQQLPPDYENVLWFHEFMNSQIVGYFRWDLEDIILCDLDENDQTFQIYEMTHWMPLPAPPKEC